MLVKNGYNQENKGKVPAINHSIKLMDDNVKVSDIITQREYSEYAHSIIEALRDPLFVTDAKGEIIDMNEAWLKITGLTRNELIGTDFSDYFIESEQACELFGMAFEKGVVKDCALSVLTKNGKH